MSKVVSIMSGNVWKLLVKEGDQVEVGQDVVILESMKMEIPIAAEVAGTVKNVLIEEGQFINEDDEILTIE